MEAHEFLWAIDISPAIFVKGVILGPVFISAVLNRTCCGHDDNALHSGLPARLEYIIGYIDTGLDQLFGIIRVVERNGQVNDILGIFENFFEILWFFDVALLQN